MAVPSLPAYNKNIYTDMSKGSSDGIFTNTGDSRSHTLQSYTELIYVKKANDDFLRYMSQLNDALDITSQAMRALARLQAVKNQVTANFANLNKPYTYQVNGPGDWTNRASNYYTQTANLNPNFASDVYNELQDVVSILRNCQSVLNAQTGQKTSGTTLYANLTATLNDLNGQFDRYSTSNRGLAAGNQTGAKTISWVQDGYTQAGQAATSGTQAGGIDTRIAASITAAGALNTTQSDSARNFLYVYQQYYTSASAVLSGMTQIIQKMAANINK